MCWAWNVTSRLVVAERGLVASATPFPVTTLTVPYIHSSSKDLVMNLRPFVSTDVPALTALTIDTFRPFYEGYARTLLGDEIFHHQHGRWDQDYRDEVPTLHNPLVKRFVAVAEIDGTVAGYVSWRIEGRPHHGEIYLLAVAKVHRRQQIGGSLCRYAIAQMKVVGVEVVEIGTGDDAFHAAARGLYEELGFTKIPVAAYLKRI